MEENTKQTKFTYEQLEQIAGNLSSQVQTLSVQLRDANMFNTFKRLEFLFKAVEVHASTGYLEEAFAEKCSKEIEELMTLETEAQLSPDE